MNKKLTISFLVSLAVLFFLTSSISAYTIQDLPNTEVTRDIVLSPGKVELFLNSGEFTTKNILVTNRLGGDIEINIEVEDFTGSDNPEEALVLLGEGKGVRSLKDYIKPEVENFVLSHGQQMNLPIEIAIPDGIEPGGLYGAVFVSASLPAGGDGDLDVITRIGSLFFVKVEGESFEDGWLRKFDTKVGKRFFESSPISFEVLFENKGNVHLLPYGVIEINNTWGRQVTSIEIDPWFVMPDSLRAREIKWDEEKLFGRYKAYLKINRGYGNVDVVDEAVVTFWVLPWKVILVVLLALVLLGAGIRLSVARFEIRKK